MIPISPGSLSTNEKDSRAKWLLTKALLVASNMWHVGFIFLVSNIYI